MHRRPEGERPTDAARSHPFPARWRHAAAGALLFLLLAACGGGGPNVPPPDPPDPPGPSGQLSLVVAPDHMNGVTVATVQVASPTDWTLSATGDAEIVSRLNLSRTSGSGNATVTLTVDPSGLSNLPTYRFALRLVTDEGTRTADVEFSFPDVYGQVLLRDIGTEALLGPEADLEQLEPTVVRPEGHGGTPGGNDGDRPEPEGSKVHPLQVAPAAHELEGFSTRAPDGTLDVSAVDLAALTSDAGTVTLLVGLEAADRGLAAASLPGEPAASALRSLSTTVAGLAGAAVEGRFDEAGLAFVEVPADEVEEAAARLAATAGVRYVELPVPIYPFSNDPYRHLQWNLDTVGAERLWPVSRGTGVTIAILDNGFYPNHEDLARNVVGQYDAGDQKSSAAATNPSCGTHGTHVAGIAAAVADNGRGIAGAAPGAGLYLIDLDYETRPGCPMDSFSLVRGLQHVMGDGTPRAEIVNMSLGASGDLGQGVRDALVAAEAAGLILIGSAGNTACARGQDTFVPVSYPAAYPEVWAIGATDPNDERACYSHVGGELLLMAPGGDSSVSADREDGIFSTDREPAARRDIYSWMEGTSMASPLVAGVVALLKGAVPDATPDEILQALIDTATDLGPSGFDYEYGHGLIDAPAALDALTEGAEPPPPPPPPPPVHVVFIEIPGYGDEPHRLDDDGIVLILDAPVGPLTVVAGTDDNGNGVIGEPGEYWGTATVNVAFDEANRLYVDLERVPR